jgi:hypothetical protein
MGLNQEVNKNWAEIARFISGEMKENEKQIFLNYICSSDEEA